MANWQQQLLYFHCQIGCCSKILSDNLSKPHSHASILFCEVWAIKYDKYHVVMECIIPFEIIRYFLLYCEHPNSLMPSCYLSTCNFQNFV